MSTKKLTLNKETLRQLTEDQVQKVAGGVYYPFPTTLPTTSRTLSRISFFTVTIPPTVTFTSLTAGH